MKKIISCSRRTDVPAFYYDLLQSWLKDEKVINKNPYYPDKEYTTSLSPDDIHSIVLWSKDYSNVANNPGFLELYNLYFNYTITLYGKIIEPNVPAFYETIKTLEKLITKYKSEQFAFRYDPVFLSDCSISSTYNARVNCFNTLCKTLKQLGYNNSKIVTSYISVYGKVEKNLKDNHFTLTDLSEEDILKLFEELAFVANDYGFTLYSCSSPLLENIPSIKKNACIDADVLDSLFGKCTKSKDAGQRENCGCAKSSDIGGYFPCNHKCIYCYANTK